MDQLFSMEEEQTDRELQQYLRVLSTRGRASIHYDLENHASAGCHSSWAPGQHHEQELRADNILKICCWRLRLGSSCLSGKTNSGIHSWKCASSIDTATAALSASSLESTRELPGRFTAPGATRSTGRCWIVLPSGLLKCIAWTLKVHSLVTDVTVQNLSIPGFWSCSYFISLIWVSLFFLFYPENHSSFPLSSVKKKYLF